MQKNDKSGAKKAKNIKLNFLDSVNVMLAGLPERSRDILKKRFGLASGEAETLERIGQDYVITRERVRQIISDAINKVAKLSETDVFRSAEERIVLEITRSSGIMSEERLVEKLGTGNPTESNAITFFAVCSKKLNSIGDKGLVKNSWAISKSVLNDVKKVNEAAKEVLNASKVPLTDAEIAEKIMVKDSGFSKNEILDLLDVLVPISKNKFGKWGFSGWMEINPKGTRERIYLVLKEVKKPLHFREIAKLIDKSGINKKKSHPQTVHNELIKDKRFVLIGRGIYALSEWGYEPGTIKDILEDILKKSEKPMTKEEVVEEVLKMRKVKKTTIMINLNNKGLFVRHGEGYALKGR